VIGELEGIAGKESGEEPVLKLSGKIANATKERVKMSPDGILATARHAGTDTHEDLVK